ncbi:MAG: sigma factor-like helix-turn-helix DNA-binding protein [Patescibacteria group bacterium]|nr:sigma factor-like helix-turn-helix DNA-binding protein [Patescibacteria group bacterium]
MTSEKAAKIIDKIESNKIKDAHFSQFARDLISNLKEKQQKVILHRFGLSGRKRLTLDAIGKEFGVTRERVRQIEAASLNRLRKLSVLDHNKPVFEKIKAILGERGGIINEDALVEELIIDLDQSRKEEITKILKFILLLNEDIAGIEESENINAGWHLTSLDKKMIEDIVKMFSQILESKGEVLEDEAILLESAKHEIVEKYKGKATPEFLKSSIDMTKKLHRTEDGKRGLTSWSWVKPRTIRDKIFFVLSKKNEPMHFSEIATAIEQSSFDNKKATIQTIHNELISDNRFVLVGRGLYALNNWGFEGGTVEGVIEKVLKDKAPLDQNSVVEEVMKKKKVKKATILINLQNSPKFKKTSEGYILAN